MNVTHVCLCGIVVEGLSYQDNLLPRFHKNIGYHVEIIASCEVLDKNGRLYESPELDSDVVENNIPVKRLMFRKPTSVFRKLRFFKALYCAIDETEPDILFVHGCQSLSLLTISRYMKRNSRIRVYIDSHADFSNSAKNWFSKRVLHNLLWRSLAHLVEPFTIKFYGTLPARVDFLKNVYKLPPEKCELLVLGANDELVKEAKRPEVKKDIRTKYRIEDDDFLIMTGGKIDLAKRQTLLLMEAVQKINNPKVKLIVFGSVVLELRESVKALSDGIKVQYIGWVQANDSYKYFAAADIAVFPGRHSVFWEQVVGQGVPILCKFWEGTTHIDLGGNAEFIYDDTTEEIYDKLATIINDIDKYEKMRTVANEKGMEAFSYKKIAEKSIAI